MLIVVPVQFVNTFEVATEKLDLDRQLGPRCAGLFLAAGPLPSTILRSMAEQVTPSMATPVAHGDAEGARLAVLRLLEQRPDMSQRELSGALGLSLGRTHYVLHALLDKGLVKIENFKRNDNKLAYAYLLTPKGLRAKLSLTRSFLARKEAEFELLRTTIARLRQEVHPTSTSDSAS